MVSISNAQIASVFLDAGYVLGVLAGADVLLSSHPEIAAWLGIGATISAGLALRINPPATAIAAAPAHA